MNVKKLISTNLINSKIIKKYIYIKIFEIFISDAI